MSTIELDDLGDFSTTFPLVDNSSGPKVCRSLSSEILKGDQASLRLSQQQVTDIRSPTSSPSVTFRSTPTNMSLDPKVISRTPSSGRASPKTPGTTHDRVIFQAISRRQTEPGWSGLLDPPSSMYDAGHTAGKSVGFQDESLLEPYPYERVKTTLSEIFAHTGSFDYGVNLHGFGGHRDTFAILGLRHRQARDINLPTSFFERLVQYIDFETYLAVRLSCRLWSTSLSQVRPPTLSPAYKLPAEIIEQILYALSPLDFNAARHTCRAWMIASLETRILTSMLKHGGWSAAVEADRATVERRPHLALTKEWPLSKRLATECQLRPEWTGNGLPHPDDRSSPEHPDRTGLAHLPALSLTREIDFSELSSPSQSREQSQHESGRLFTPSVCGQYLLLTVESRVFIYMVHKEVSSFDPANGHGIEAITSVVCPRQILAVSMDTSCGRLAVAALLEGRVGFVCELTSRSHIPLTVWRHSSNTRFEISGDDLDIEEPLPNESLAFHNYRGEMAPFAKEELPLTNTPERYSISSSSDDILVEKGPRSIFRNLCSAEDPPRSVAICPQRRCVAFGCVAGVEIHWTDILDGQGMTRWIPIANTSDYLYFLPPRPDVDSVKRLRLTSSAAHPSEKARLDARFAPQLQEAREDEMVWESTSKMAFPGAFPSPEPSKPDHYRTVPLSDGYHALFTDPESGCVCLGCLPDVPANNACLAKRVLLRGPQPESADEVSLVPKCYAAGPELAWGGRIAVGYSDGSLWLFSVPADMFLASRSDNEQWELGWVDECNRCGSIDEAIYINEDGTGWIDWPVQIHGVHVADIPGLEDVIIDASNGSVTLWAFSNYGLARKWELSTGADPEVRKSTVLTDGTIVPAAEDDGDWIMRNAPWVPSYASTPAGYDGTTSSMHQHPAWNLGSRTTMRPGTPDSGYASDEGEPATSVDDRLSLGSLTARFRTMKLNDGDSDSDVELRDRTSIDNDIDEGYVSARESRAVSLMDVDGPPTILDGHDYPLELPTPQSEQLTQLGRDVGQHISHDAANGDSYDGIIEQWASSPTALYIPCREKRWSGESFEEHDWTPDYLGTKDDDEGDEGDAGGDLDLLDLREVEFEIL